ncbi:hypothetical protein DFH09DRAFT_1466225 [Mycena vulgaris]|nr:hypothetical protein DFH09DRAFT_1466225 [Mycena vulgaris]
MVVRGGASGKRGKLTVKAESESRVPVFGRVVPKAEVTRVIRVLPPSCQCALQTTADLSGYPHLRSSLGGKIDKWSPTLQDLSRARSPQCLKRRNSAQTTAQHGPVQIEIHAQSPEEGPLERRGTIFYVPIPWNLGVFERYCAALLSYCDSDSDFRRVLFFSGGCNLSVAPAPWVRLQYFKVLVRSCCSFANWPQRAISGSYLVSSTLFVASPTYVFTGFTCSTLKVNAQFQKSYSRLRVHDSIHVLLSPSLQPCIRSPTARTPLELSFISSNGSLVFIFTRSSAPHRVTSLVPPFQISGCVDSITRRSPPDSRKRLEGATPQCLCPACETV